MPAEAGGGTTTAASERGRRWRLVTLGDAFTLGYGTALHKRDSWPAQLVESLRRGDVEVQLTNLADFGYTAGRVLDSQLPQVAAEKPDVVTLQVGMSDLYTGETEWYRGDLDAVLDGLLEILPAAQIFVVTTPSDTLDPATPVDTDRAAVREAIEWLNTTLSASAAERGIEVIDIRSVNALAETDPTLVELDYLSYPSAKQYAGWAEVIGPYVYGALAAIEP